ncbi:LPXTG cell wall anchor domain-containing protein [Actinoplanes sp. Pm04-4]|uniref:LPXTG cell wall anchor domain-containing protein n=1 Tax=Paractinoplanes pyxinae TaxID=2997416 RepID=A0ABT4ASE8_9ACTN|nr:LPXTG cell wall anchor domain-containing protein [Actinoplanes pyxinae]MCY1136645.1 LPXTG cell wall anchor domain-containing protein [Actinoplanes pyxinae]
MLPDVAVAAGAGTQVAPILFAEKDTVLYNTAMTFELSGDLDGVAFKADEFGDCQADGATKLTCSLPFEFDLGPDGVIGYFEAELTAAKTALGKTGKITTTFTADGIAKVTTTAGVTVAEGVDLAAGKGSKISVKAGAGFDAKLQVTNTSDKVLHGAAIIFNTDYAFSSAREFSNCRYSDGQVNTCLFEQDLQPGATYRTSLPYRLRPDTAAPGGAYGEMQWLTGDDYQDLLEYMDKAGYEGPGRAGKGGKLGLTAQASAREVQQTDPDLDNNWQNVEIKVLGRQGTDFAAVGATAKGAKGDTVTLPVGTRNNGPATRDASRIGSAAATVIVTIPAQAKVVSVPDGCTKAEDDSVKTNPKALQYVCFSSPLFKAKTTVLWKFGVQLTADVTNAKGLVEVNPPCQCERFAKDTNKKNDTAAIVINPVAGAGSGGQGGGGSLPITGSQTALFGGAGAVLVAAGVLGFFVARRRRTRFEA